MTASEDRSCIRCGICCCKGGPALHLEDLSLFTKGILTKVDVWTIRRGEPVSENVEGRLTLATEELIKIKGQGVQWTCRFYQGEGCSVYENRPMECRLLKCWDETPLQEYYTKNRLQRVQLLGQDSALVELVQYHETAFSWGTWRPSLCRALLENDLNASKAILTMGQEEDSFRQSLVKRVPQARAILEFLFGRRVLDLFQSWSVRPLASSKGIYLASSEEFKATLRSLKASSSRT